ELPREDGTHKDVQERPRAVGPPGHLGLHARVALHRVCYVLAMDMVRQVVVFDAADLDAESTFWAGIFGGHVFRDDSFHSVIDASGGWYVGVQLAPNHVPPDWPDGAP